jgi:hypothetical protein
MKRVELEVHIRGSIRDKHCQLSYFAATYIETCYFFMRNSGSCKRKAREQLNWRPVWDCLTTIDRTVDWHRSHYEEGSLRTAGDPTAYQSELSKFPLS